MASDQSETSGGSRVRQFGLYRSIDSRTEEFLKLSRKRQMRQGCACAAISTAITVTIIVGVLLLFEYNVTSSEDHKSTVPNWHNLLNDTAEAMSLNTLKMLPILIKELHKNKIESTTESTTKRLNPEKRHTTEFSYKKDVFSNRKNWIRLPASRIYAIEYKTPSIAYFKTPKSDYFTKIRKIRDYQRIINYVDKMISDRVSLGSTQPMQTIEDFTTDDVQTQKIPSKKFARTPNEPKEPPIPNIFTTTGNPKPKSHSNKNCNCPNKIGDILNDLVSNIKLLVPHPSTTDSQHQKLQSDILMRSNEINDFTPSANLDTLNNQIIKGLLNQNTKLRQYEKSSTKTDKPIVGSLSSLGYDRTDGKTVFGLLQQKFTGQKTYFFKGYVKNDTSTPRTFIEMTESYIPLQFIAPTYRENHKSDQAQKKTSDRFSSTSTTKEQFTQIHDPLHFNANNQEEDEEENMKNEDYKAPPELIVSTPTSPLHFANNYPLHFIANTRDYEESSVKNNFKKMTSEKDVSTSTLYIHAITPKYRKNKMRNDDRKISSQGIITTSTTNIYYVKKDPLHEVSNPLDYEEDNKKNTDKEMPTEKTYDEGAEEDFMSTKNTADVIIQSHSNIKKDGLSSKRKKTMWPAQNKNTGSGNNFYPMITTHFLYHRHNITTTITSKLDLMTTTETPIPSVRKTTSTATINVEDTTTSPFKETFNFTSDLLKPKIRGSDSPSNYQKFKDDTGFRFEELNLDDDFDKIINEDNYQEMNEKEDFISTVFNNIESQTKQNVFKITKVNPRSTTTDPKEKDEVFFTSSVFHNKPRSYLEIQRNYLNEK